MIARAALNVAKARAIFWLETFTCSSRAFKSGSPYISHHLPRIAASFGSATFHPSTSLYLSGISLYEGAIGTDGLLYGCLTLQPDESKAAITNKEINEAVNGRIINRQ